MTLLLQKADPLIARMLFVKPRVADEQVINRAERAFNTSLAISAVRCIIQYVILPFVLPVIGVAGEVAIPISLTINVVALGAIWFSLRRFWQVDYKGKWQYLGIALAAVVLLIVFIATDLSKLIGVGVSSSL
jgi:ABC-type iron transport system FetAB permease component